jgi:diacylglycerol kinase (ATP)
VKKYASCGFYLVACTAERFFRIDRGQEQLHYVTDVAVEAVYVLDEDSAQQQSDGQAGSSQQTVASRETETAHIRLPRYAAR